MVVHTAATTHRPSPRCEKQFYRIMRSRFAVCEGPASVTGHPKQEIGMTYVRKDRPAFHRELMDDLAVMLNLM